MQVTKLTGWRNSLAEQYMSLSKFSHYNFSHTINIQLIQRKNKNGQNKNKYFKIYTENQSPCLLNQTFGSLIIPC